MPTTKKEYRGRPRIILSEDKAMKALDLLARRLSFRAVAESIGIHERWLSRAYQDKRLHEMAGQKRAGELIPRPSSFILSESAEKGEPPW